MDQFRRNGISPLTSPSPPDVIRSGHEPLCALPMDVTAPNVQTPERQGGPLRAPISKESRTSRETEELPRNANLNEHGISSRADNTLFLAVTQDDRARAISYPLLGWPEFVRLFGDNGGVHPTHSILDAAPYRNMASNSSCTREAGVDTVSIALAEAGAMFVDQRGFCMLDGRGSPEFPLANSHFLEYTSPDRRIRQLPVGNSSWRTCVRRGNQTSGSIQTRAPRPSQVLLERSPPAPSRARPVRISAIHARRCMPGPSRKGHPGYRSSGAA